jgi:glycosyltransferase involved in cell wall biosynthesis
MKWETNIKEDKITVIPCCVDINHFDIKQINDTEKAKFREELKITINNEVLCYLGSLGTWYMLDEMLDFFKSYSSKSPQAKFFFITQDDHNLILTKAIERGIDANKLIFRKGQRHEIPTLLSLCNYSIFFINPTYSKKASSPTKQGELMAMGIPLICNAGVGDTDSIVDKYKSGVVCTHFTTDEYEHSIVKLLSIQFDTNQLRNGAIDYFSLDNGIKNYGLVYSKLLND